MSLLFDLHLGYMSRVTSKSGIQVLFNGGVRQKLLCFCDLMLL